MVTVHGIAYFLDVVIHALDHIWEIHKPYLQKSLLLSSLIKKAEKEGLNDIDEEEENEATHRLAGKMFFNVPAAYFC